MFDALVGGVLGGLIASVLFPVGALVYVWLRLALRDWRLGRAGKD